MVAEPLLELGGTEIRCCISCEEDDDDEQEEDDVALARLDRGQPSVPGAERGRELVAQWWPAAWWVALG